VSIWSTPQRIFDALNAEFHFSIDVCADADNRKCSNFIPRSLSLATHISWIGRCWLNPPYGKEIAAYLKKAKQASIDGSLVRSR
jgi:phage N-6-adenine-methyltransferase